jgi:hypothetical protein
MYRCRWFDGVTPATESPDSVWPLLSDVIQLKRRYETRVVLIISGRATSALPASDVSCGKRGIRALFPVPRGVHGHACDSAVDFDELSPLELLGVVARRWFFTSPG